MTPLDVVKRHYAASEAGDLSAMTQDFASDIEWKEADGFLTAGTYVGAAAIIDGVFGPSNETWDGFRVTVEKLVVQDDTVVMIGNYSGTHRKTGKKLDIRVVHIWTVQAEKIIAFEQICDTYPAQQAAVEKC